MKYAVHLYPTVRVKVINIEAQSAAEAVTKAEGAINLHDVLDNFRPNASNVEAIAWDEGETNYVLVDPLNNKGEVIDEESLWLDGAGNLLVDGKTLVEQKAAAADDARLFMQELLDSVESLGGIAETYGVRTVIDLMYLQSAILNGGFIDNHFPESSVLEFASSLPSGTRWMQHIKTGYLAERPNSN